MSDAERERALIVKWLRAAAAKTRADAAGVTDDFERTIGMAMAEAMAEAMDMASKGIERLDHIKGV